MLLISHHSSIATTYLFDTKIQEAEGQFMQKFKIKHKDPHAIGANTTQLYKPHNFSRKRVQNNLMHYACSMGN